MTAVNGEAWRSRRVAFKNLDLQTRFRDHHFHADSGDHARRVIAAASERLDRLLLAPPDDIEPDLDFLSEPVAAPAKIAHIVSRQVLLNRSPYLCRRDIQWGYLCDSDQEDDQQLLHRHVKPPTSAGSSPPRSTPECQRQMGCLRRIDSSLALAAIRSHLRRHCVEDIHVTESPDQIAGVYVARWQKLWNERGAVSALYTDDSVLVGFRTAIGRADIAVLLQSISDQG